MEIAVQNRELLGKKFKSLKKKGLVPGVVYGKHIKEPINIQFNKQGFIKLYKKTGSSTPITLKGDGIDNLVLVQDYQLDPVSDELLHVDFLGLKKGEKVKTYVKVELQGKSKVEKLGEGNIQLIKDELEVEALPKDLPHSFVVDVSKIENLNDVIFVKDLEVAKGVEILEDFEQALVTVVAMVEEIEEELEEEEMEEGEVAQTDGDKQNEQDKEEK